MNTEDRITISIVTEINKAIGSIIEFSSDYRKEDNGVHCYVRFYGELARIQERCLHEFTKLSKEERMRCVELVMRNAMKYQLPNLTLPDELDLFELFRKETTENENEKKFITGLKLTMCVLS